MASDSVTEEEVRLVLVGSTGSGKSASANTILGEKRFHSKARLTSTARTCKVQHKTRFGHDIVIVDTPPAFDTNLSQAEIAREIIQCITMSAPGPHAFIMVLQAKKFTPEEEKTIEHIENIFGERIYDYMFLLFTRIDDLEEDGQNFEEILDEAPENLKSLIDKCGRRYVGFNNREKDETKKEEMARRLIDMIKVRVNRNGGRCYTSALLKDAEKEAKKRREKKKIENDIIRKVREDMIKIEKEREEMIKEVRQEMITEMRKVREELIKIEKEREEMIKEVRQEVITEVRKAREELIKIEKEREEMIKIEKEREEMLKYVRQEMITEVRKEREEMKKEVRQEMITEVGKVREELTKIEKEREEMKKDVRQEMITEVGKVREEVTRKIDKENEKQTEAIKSLERTCTDSVTDNELLLVMIGITGSGKSASANTILGDKLFPSRLSISPVTETCKVKHKTRFGRDIVIINTPGIFDTEGSHGEITIEIIQCIEMSAPGPHAFIMVLQAKRFTPEEQNTIEYFEQVFGKAMFDYLFLLFTHVDDLEYDGKTLEGFLSTAPKNLKELIDKCGRRYVGFNNREKDEKKKEKWVLQLIEMIQKNVNKNHGNYFKPELLDKAEKEIQKREKEILKKELQKQLEKII